MATITYSPECATNAVRPHIARALLPLLTPDDIQEIRENYLRIFPLQRERQLATHHKREFIFVDKIRCAVQGCATEIYLTERKSPKTRFMCSCHGAKRTEEVRISESIFGPWEVQNTNLYPDKEAHFQEHQQFHRELQRSSSGNKHQDEAPLLLQPFVQGRPYVIAERIRLKNLNRIGSCGSSALVYSFTYDGLEPASLPYADFHVRSENSERTMMARTVYFNIPHEHPVELSACVNCIPFTIDRAASFYCQETAVIGRRRSMIPAEEPKEERINAIETLKHTVEGGSLSSKAREQRMQMIRADCAAGKIGDPIKLFEAYVEIDEQGENYVSGSIPLNDLFTSKGRVEAALTLIEFENKGVKEMAQSLNIKPNTLTQRRRRLRKPLSVGPQCESYEAFFKTTRAQLEAISEHGGVVAIRWTGGRRVQIVPFPQGALTLKSENGTVDAWEEWMLKHNAEHGCNLIDMYCRIARQHSQYQFHVESLPEGTRPVHDAWKTDAFAQAKADKLWSSVIVFNFGAPGFIDRYVNMSQEMAVKFAMSGYKPQPVALLAKQTA